MKQDFLKLYDSTVDEIYGFCFNKLSDRELAKSITEDTYTKMWSSITPDFPLTHAKMMLLGIAARLVRQYQKEEQRAQQQFATTFQYSL